MPTLISETDVRLERADLLRRVILPRAVSESGFIVPPARTSGLHQSGLFRYIAEKSKITSYVEQVSEDEHPLRWALGQAWEEFAASLYPDMLWQPFEATDPVIMSCDGVSGTDECIEEFKFNRFKKWAGPDMIARKWLWMMQGASYCLGYGLKRVRWHVLAAMEWPDPVYTKYMIEFSDKELYDVQKMIEKNKAKAIAEGYAE